MKPSFYVISFIGFLGVVLGAPQRKIGARTYFRGDLFVLDRNRGSGGISDRPSIVIAFASIYVAQMLYLTALFHVCGEPEFTRGLGPMQSFDTSSPREYGRQAGGYFAAAAMMGQSAICTCTMSWYLPPSGLKIEASPSLTSNQSLPRASMIFGLWVMRMVFFPSAGVRPSAARNAWCAAVVLVGRHHEPAFGQIGCFLDIGEAGEHGRLIGAVELARIDLPDGYTRRTQRGTERAGQFLALVVEIALLADVGEIERVRVGLVGEGRSVPHENDEPTRSQRPGQRRKVRGAYCLWRGLGAAPHRRGQPLQVSNLRQRVARIRVLKSSWSTPVAIHRLWRNKRSTPVAPRKGRQWAACRYSGTAAQFTVNAATMLGSNCLGAIVPPKIPASVLSAGEMMSENSTLPSDIEGIDQSRAAVPPGFHDCGSRHRRRLYAGRGPVRADVIKTDISGLKAGDAKAKVADGEMPVYFRPNHRGRQSTGYSGRHGGVRPA